MAVAEATKHQARARLVLGAALESGPSHAYLFQGPRGAGKREAARAFAAELLATAASADPDDARRRALLDPSPHPDLIWLAPSGAQHLVEEVRERVIRAASYRPFEGGRRVFVIEAAEAMRDESQNALLKTLEEPPGFVHLILLSSEPTALLETISSRCQRVDFVPLPVEAVEAALGQGRLGADLEGAGDGQVRGAGDAPRGAERLIPGDATDEEVTAAARLSAGNIDLARYLLSERGRRLRAEAVKFASAAGPAEAGGGDAPWKALLQGAESAGDYAETLAREALDEETAAGIKRSARDIVDEAKRAGRRRRTQILDQGLGLSAAWFRDLAATSAGATEAVFNRDSLAELWAQAAALGADPAATGRGTEAAAAVRGTGRTAPAGSARTTAAGGEAEAGGTGSIRAVARARRAAELVQDTRRRLDLNVSEELALEALFFRLDQALRST